MSSAEAQTLRTLIWAALSLVACTVPVSCRDAAAVNVEPQPAAVHSGQASLAGTSDRMVPATGMAERVFPRAPSAGPQAPDEFTFLVYGDTRSNPQGHRAAVQALQKIRNASFVCHTGDMVGDGSSAREWEGFLSVIAPLTRRLPFYPAVGNHDLPRSAAVSRVPVLRERWAVADPSSVYYGVKYGSLALAILDSMSLRQGDQAQLDWIRAFFAGSQARHRMACFHEPLWSPGPNGSSPALQRALLPVLREAGVELVFCGHDHMYYRTSREGLVQVVTAGGGAPLYDVKDRSVLLQGDVLHRAYHVCVVGVGRDSASLTAVDLHGAVLDQFTVSR